MRDLWSSPRFPQPICIDAHRSGISPPEHSRVRESGPVDKPCRPMTAPLKRIEGTGDLAAAMAGIGRKAREAARVLALAPAAQKSDALGRMAGALRAGRAAILA